MKILKLVYLVILMLIAHSLFAIYYAVVAICSLVIRHKKYNRCHTDYLILGVKDTLDDVQEQWRILWA